MYICKILTIGLDQLTVAGIRSIIGEIGYKSAVLDWQELDSGLFTEVSPDLAIIEERDDESAEQWVIMIADRFPKCKVFLMEDSKLVGSERQPRQLNVFAYLFKDMEVPLLAEKLDSAIRERLTGWN